MLCFVDTYGRPATFLTETEEEWIGAGAEGSGKGMRGEEQGKTSIGI